MRIPHASAGMVSAGARHAATASTASATVLQAIARPMTLKTIASNTVASLKCEPTPRAACPKIQMSSRIIEPATTGRTQRATGRYGHSQASVHR